MLPLLVATPGLVILVAEPAGWLLRSWADPSSGNLGAWVGAATVALLAASVWSGPASSDPRSARRGWALLAATALLRVAGRVLDVNTVGALALAVDVGALGVLLGVARRPFALHPGWLAGFFAFSLPLETLAQRILGHPLQLLAARVAEALLAPWAPGLERHGVLLLHPDVALAVDLPCSGARGLCLLGALALLLATTRSFDLRTCARAALATLVGAGAANVCRIALLFVASARDFPVSEEPWHSAIGCLALGLGALPLLVVGRRAPLRAPRSPRSAIAQRGRWRLSPLHAAGFAALGVAVAVTPARPLDRGSVFEGTKLPISLGRWAGAPLALRDVERRYFETWGGRAEKRVYDDGSGHAHTALLVRTRSPLRHLHSPERCLIGAGHRVSRVGVRAGPLPTVVFRSRGPDGRTWRVESSFVSESGALATTVSEVVWAWWRAPETPWALVQRVTPWALCEEDPARCGAFEDALRTSLDLPAATTLADSSPRRKASP